MHHSYMILFFTLTENRYFVLVKNLLNCKIFRLVSQATICPNRNVENSNIVRREKNAAICKSIEKVRTSVKNFFTPFRIACKSSPVFLLLFFLRVRCFYKYKYRCITHFFWKKNFEHRMWAGSQQLMYRIKGQKGVRIIIFMILRT